jgi:cell division initiation protein
MRGIDDLEVRAYLDLVADRLEESIQEAVQLREAAERTAQDIREYRAMEKALRESLVAAERITEERLGVAEREARLIVKNAEVEAEKIVAHAREWSARYRAELEDLRRQRTTFLERFRALLSSQSKILEATAHEFMAIESGPTLPADLPPLREAPTVKDVTTKDTQTTRDAQATKDAQTAKDAQASRDAQASKDAQATRDEQVSKDAQSSQIAREAAALKEMTAAGRAFPLREMLTARDAPAPSGPPALPASSVPPALPALTTPPPVPPQAPVAGTDPARSSSSYLGEEGLFIPGAGAFVEGERG